MPSMRNVRNQSVDWEEYDRNGRGMRKKDIVARSRTRRSLPARGGYAHAMTYGARYRPGESKCKATPRLSMAYPVSFEDYSVL
jgi:hypothetical protein